MERSASLPQGGGIVQREFHAILIWPYQQGAPSALELNQ
jgi:hypothetical protein